MNKQSTLSFTGTSASSNNHQINNNKNNNINKRKETSNTGSDTDTDTDSRNSRRRTATFVPSQNEVFTLSSSTPSHPQLSQQPPSQSQVVHAGPDRRTVSATSSSSSSSSSSSFLLSPRSWTDDEMWILNDHAFQDVYLNSIKQYKKLYETLKKTDDKVRKLQIMKDNEHTSKNMSRTTTLSLASSMSDGVKSAFIAKQKEIDEKANSDSRDNALKHETLHRDELVALLNEHMFTLTETLTSFLMNYTSSSSSSSPSSSSSSSSSVSSLLSYPHFDIDVNRIVRYVMNEVEMTMKRWRASKVRSEETRKLREEEMLRKKNEMKEAMCIDDDVQKDTIRSVIKDEIRKAMKQSSSSSSSSSSPPSPSKHKRNGRKKDRHTSSNKKDDRTSRSQSSSRRVQASTKTHATQSRSRSRSRSHTDTPRTRSPAPHTQHTRSSSKNWRARSSSRPRSMNRAANKTKDSRDQQGRQQQRRRHDRDEDAKRESTHRHSNGRSSGSRDKQ